MPHDKDGREINDPTPVQAPVYWRAPPTIQQQIQRYVRTELSRQAAEAGVETFEEADNFDTGDDEELKSPYELDAEVEQLPRWKEDRERQEAIRQAEERFVAGLPPQGQGTDPAKPVAPSAGALGSSRENT